MTWERILLGLTLACLLVWFALTWLEPEPWAPSVDDAFPRSDQDAALYDLCLAQDGNRVRCDAIMRVIDRSRAAKGAGGTTRINAPSRP